MKHFRIEVEIHAPADRVWSVMTDFARWREWTPSVTSIEQLDPGPIAPGIRLLIRQPKLLPAVWTLTELKEGQSFQSVTGGPGVKVIARHGIEPAESGSRVTLSLEFAGFLGGLVGRLTGGLNERYLALEAAGLKQRSEG